MCTVSYLIALVGAVLCEVVLLERISNVSQLHEAIVRTLQVFSTVKLFHISNLIF
jgi:hypothetical protein